MTVTLIVTLKWSLALIVVCKLCVRTMNNRVVESVLPTGSGVSSLEMCPSSEWMGKYRAGYPWTLEDQHPIFLWAEKMWKCQFVVNSPSYVHWLLLSIIGIFPCGNGLIRTLWLYHVYFRIKIWVGRVKLTKHRQELHCSSLKMKLHEK